MGPSESVPAGGPTEATNVVVPTETLHNDDNRQPPPLLSAAPTDLSISNLDRDRENLGADRVASPAQTTNAYSIQRWLGRNTIPGTLECARLLHSPVADVVVAAAGCERGYRRAARR